MAKPKTGATAKRKAGVPSKKKAVSFDDARVAVHSEALARRQMTALDDLVVQTALHRRDTGFRHPDVQARKSFFWDLHDRFFDPGSRILRPLVIDEIRELVVLWATPGASLGSRQLSALMLAHVARAIARGGPSAQASEQRLRDDILELEPVLAEILDETGLSAKIAMALVCARARCARAVTVPRITDLKLREVVEAAYAGDEASFSTALDAIDDAILEDRASLG
jgi:hypothetical protein